MKKLYFSLFAGSIFLLIFVGCGKDPKSDNPPAVQKPDLTYSFTEVVANNIKVITLEWESFDATTCTLNGNPVALKDSKVFEIPVDTTFTFVVIGEGGTIQKKVMVKAFVAEPLPMPTIVFFKADQYTLPEGGGGTWLSWEIHNAYIDSVLVNGIMQTDTVGSFHTGFISNPGNTDLQVTYTLTAKGPGGTKTSQLTLTVPAVPPPPTIGEILCAETRTLVYKEYAYTIDGPRILLFSYTPSVEPETWKFSLPNSLIVAYGSQQTFHNWTLNDSIIQGFGDKYIVKLTTDTLIFYEHSFEYQGNTLVPTFTWNRYVKL